jgi:hypothetical protein
MGNQPSVHAVAVRPHGRKNLRYAGYPAAICEVEAVHKVVSQKIGFKIAKQHYQKHGQQSQQE